jgi:hypothetical protein
VSQSVATTVVSLKGNLQGSKRRQQERTAMPRVSPETSKATKLMLDQLKKLSPVPVGEAVEAALLSVPEDRRERVLSV